MKYKKIVVKLGSNIITNAKQSYFISLAKQIKTLLDKSCEVIIVSSGAIATGIKEYDILRKPQTVIEKQAYAAIGQPLLMYKYITSFGRFSIKAAQILLTREDFEDRQRYINVKNTLSYLLKNKVIPIINENDTIATEEIKLGDNDTLSAIVAAKMDADVLILLTDVDGVYDKNPSTHSTANFIQEVYDIDEIIANCEISSSGKFFCGTGGMTTKLIAAKICSLSGIETVIANGFKKNVIVDIINGKKMGTKFYPKRKNIDAKEKWIAFVKKSKGKIFIDDGATTALINKHKSLLPVGVKKVEGVFSKGDVVSICKEDGEEIARGIVNYSHSDVEKLKGKKTEDIKKEFGMVEVKEIVHTDNLVIL
ncbi:MAG: glutamate 5-kinase [Endomicrobia bacterium]|nr:glutamate 5-kinase [Endomicrobiia bacterium]